MESATWSKAGQLDWWVKERQEWWGRVRGADGRQRWIRAVDLRPVSAEAMTLSLSLVAPFDGSKVPRLATANKTERKTEHGIPLIDSTFKTGHGLLISSQAAIP